MTGMGSKWKDISVAIMILFIVSAFVLGMVFWPEFPKDGTWKGNLYYITVSSILYTSSVVWFIMAQSKIVKAATYLGMAVFSVNLYIELFLDPTHWTNWSWGLILIVALNMFLTVTLLEKIKKKADGTDTSNN